MKPKFSIVIPATRRDYLPFALESATGQILDSQKYEIIISDNSDNGMKDILNNYTQKNLKYVRPKKYLKVQEHWNFAFSQAKGDWVILLCDDDILDFECLKILEGRIKEFPYSDCFFWHYGYFKKEIINGINRTEFSFPKLDNQTVTIKSSSILKDIFDAGSGIASQHKANIPFVPKATYSRNLLERIKKQFKSYIIGPEPRAGLAHTALALTDSVIKINKVLTIIETSVEDSAANHILNDSTLKRMVGKLKLEYVPIKSMHFFPAIASDVLLKVKKISKMRGYKFNFIKFFAICYFQLLEFRVNKDIFSDVKKIYYEAYQKLSFFSRMLVQLEILKANIKPYLYILLIKLRLKKSTTWKVHTFINKNINYYNRNKEIFSDKS